MERAAKDDTERQRIRSQLYQPPAGSQPRTGDGPGSKPAAGKPTKRAAGMTMAQAQQVLADTAAEDAKLAQRRPSS